MKGDGTKQTKTYLLPPPLVFVIHLFRTNAISWGRLARNKQPLPTRVCAFLLQASRPMLRENKGALNAPSGSASSDWACCRGGSGQSLATVSSSQIQPFS